MNRSRWGVWLLLVGLAATGCARNSATDCNLTANFCACDRRTSSDNPDCRDYEAMSSSTATTRCTSAGGTLSTAGVCPTATRVGTCKFTSGSEITYQRYYLANFGTAAAAAIVCAYFKANCFVLSGNMLCDAVWTADI